MKKYIIYLTVVSLLMIAACNDPFEGQNFVTPTEIENEMTCTVLLENRSSDFSLWIELLKYADYYNGLKDSEISATVFAPTNAAMTEFLESKGVAAVQELDRDYARSVAQNHIINGLKLNSEVFVDLAVDEQYLTVPNLFQAYLKPTFGRVILDVDDDQRTGEIIDEATLFLDNQAAVQARDSGGINFVEASNAMIYYMDDVIYPLTETMVDKIEQLGDCNLFAQACRDCGYDKVASKLRDTVRILGGGYTVYTYNFTAFVPSDDAMSEAGISTLDDLKKRCREDNPEAGDSALWRYVAYHFMDQRYTRDEFCSFDTEDETLIYDTSLEGEVVTCRNDSVKGKPAINEEAYFVRSDIEARNGYIHKIDYYMPVWAPEPVMIKWDFCNSSDIISMVNIYGANKSLGMLYSSALTNKEYNIDLSEEQRDGQLGEATSFTCQINQGKASHAQYRAVGFRKCKYVSAKNKTENPYGAYLNNLLVLNLGYAGWIEFTTPTVIKGHYKVTLHYASDLTMKSFHAAGSLTKFQFDADEGRSDYTKNGFVFKGLPTTGFTYGSGDLELFNDIEFESSGIHTFKATMLDINAKTSGSYHQMWDYLLFTPVTD